MLLKFWRQLHRKLPLKTPFTLGHVKTAQKTLGVFAGLFKRLCGAFLFKVMWLKRTILWHFSWAFEALPIHFNGRSFLRRFKHSKHAACRTFFTARKRNAPVWKHSLILMEIGFCEAFSYIVSDVFFFFLKQKSTSVWRGLTAFLFCFFLIRRMQLGGVRL